MKRLGKIVALVTLVVFMLSLVLVFSPSEKAFSSAGGTKKIVFWHITTDAVGKQMIQNQVNRFLKAHPDFKVEVVPLQNDSFKTKLKIAMGSNQAPDVFVTWVAVLSLNM